MARRHNPAAFEKSRRERDKKKKKQEKLAKKRERKDADGNELRPDEIAEVDPAFLEDAEQQPGEEDGDDEVVN